MKPLSHLDWLEAESVYILREVAAECRNPVLLYSIGKDSSVLLHLAAKAFYPGRIPFPVLHIDTTWKFRDMIAFRDRRAAELGLRLIVHTNRDGLAQGIDPFRSGSRLYTDVMKTQALRQALDLYGFDAAIGGARRDEEKSRAKERIFSLRAPQHRWDPRRQRPEPWRLYNTRLAPGESVRVFPLSNWTELDVWMYGDGTLLMRDDDRLELQPGETVETRKVRFRTLGCYPLTGAIESNAASVAQIVAETAGLRRSERDGRLIDHDASASMEQKKREGYF
jgi:sulfate adenylyltransferase subunit 2